MSSLGFRFPTCHKGTWMVRWGWSSLEAELVRVADHGVGVHGEGIEHHSRVNEVLLHTLQASVQLLKPHHLGSTCNTADYCQHLALHTSLPPQGQDRCALGGNLERGQIIEVVFQVPRDSGWGRGGALWHSNEGEKAQAWNI